MLIMFALRARRPELYGNRGSVNGHINANEDLRQLSVFELRCRLDELRARHEQDEAEPNRCPERSTTPVRRRG